MSDILDLMPSLNQIKFWDVVTGQESEDVTKLPLVKPGYDSYFTLVTKPENLIDPNSQGIGRYLSALPISKLPLSLGEGNTPLIASKKYPGVYIKNEGSNPTGSFKDRETVIAMAYAREQERDELSVVSSGNAALSAALYAKIYKLPLTCYVPKRTSEEKMEMIDMFGAKKHLIGKTYEETYHFLLNNLPKNSLNLTSGVLTVRSDGAKTIAYEIWESLGKAPDVIVCPVGNGSLIAAIYHGFWDLKEWGYTDSIPAMVSVQIKGADPVNQSFKEGLWFKELKNVPDSICEAIVAEESYCSPKAVYAIRESGGFCVSVTDSEVIGGAKYAMSTEGIFPEISSASVFSALIQHGEEIRKKGDNIVLINSGTGLKHINHLYKMVKGEAAKRSL